ncbi:tRNA 2-thiouridine(34) synthase MnmA [bacterium]|nr:tRNA 2-thiouridine(34) synthase MnmA [bacterium]
MTMNRSTVLVGLSGGLDSTMAALLLRDAGYKVIGVSMKLWDGHSQPVHPEHRSCFGPHETQRLADVESMARSLELPFQVIDLSQEYREIVLNYFTQTYASGRTPNPCVRCNHKLKFDLLPAKARDRGLVFDYFATGHYARTEYNSEQDLFLLKRGVDSTKDQAYFLYALTQNQLTKTLFPLGDLTKVEVRAMARQRGLILADTEESQDFLSFEEYPQLFEQPPRPGPIFGTDGGLLGEHRGLHHYTIGQRRGLRLATGKPLYVIRIEPERNTLIIGSKQETYSDRCRIEHVHWISGVAPPGPIEVIARIRYKHRPARAIVKPQPDGSALLRFAQPQSAITPGQSAVLYQQDIVLGGGPISLQT